MALPQLPQYDTEELIIMIKECSGVPTSQLTYTDSDFCRLATNRMQNIVVPEIMSVREEYFVDFEDFSAPSSGIIAIPSKAIGEKLRSVCYVSQTNPLILINLPRLTLDTVAGVLAGGSSYFSGFYVQNNSIYLYPNTSVTVGSTIRLYYYKRALSLAPPSAYGQISSIDIPSATVVLSYVPSTWATGTRLNAVSSTAGFAITSSLATIVTVSSPSVVLDSVIGLSVGDYLSVEGYSAIPQIPVEAHAYLAQLTAAKALQGLGDRAAMEAAMIDAAQMQKNMFVMIGSRVDGSGKKIVAGNGGIRAASGMRNNGFGGIGRGGL